MKSFILRNKKRVLSIIGVITVVLIWEIIAKLNVNKIYPNTYQILISLKEILFDVRTYSMLLSTIFRIIVALIISNMISFGIIFLYDINKNFIYLFQPILTMMKSIPVIIITLFIWLLIDIKFGIYIVTLLIAIPLIVEGLKNGLDDIDESINEILRIEPKRTIIIFWRIKIPIIKNYILLTFIQTLGLSFKVMIMSEFIFQIKDSIGKELMYYKNYLEMSKLISWGIIIVVLVTIIEMVINKTKQKFKNKL